MALANPNPIVYARRTPSKRPAVTLHSESEREPIDSGEIFSYVKDIKDPEHPYSLEQLNVIQEEGIEVDDDKGRIRLVFTPTVEHCNMASLIGLSVRVQLMRLLPKRFKVDIELAAGSHVSDLAITKQLNDKERIAAALENPQLMEMIRTCLQPSEALLCSNRSSYRTGVPTMTEPEERRVASKAPVAEVMPRTTFTDKNEFFTPPGKIDEVLENEALSLDEVQKAFRLAEQEMNIPFPASP